MSTTVKLKRGSGSDPSASDMVVGEPVIRTDTAELFFKKDDGSVAKVSGGGGGPDFKYLALRNAANDGSASYPGNDFTLVTSGTTTAVSPAAANTLLVSYGGVIQRPNSGTSTSGITGFIIDGSRFKTATNLAAAPDFILYQESGGIGEPSDGTVTTAKIVDDAVTQAKIAADAIGQTELANNAVVTANFTADCVTGTQIADNAVSEQRLEVSNSPTNGYFLSAQSGNTGGLTWAAGVGGATGVDFNDSVKARFGTGNDLEIYHDGINSYIRDVGTGYLRLDTDGAAFQIRTTTGENMISSYPNGASELYYDNVKKLQTRGDGVGIASDSDALFIGDGDDVKLYHNSGNAILKSQTGTLYLASNSHIDLRTTSGSEKQAIFCNINGAVELYHNNSQKLATSSTGIWVSGAISGESVDLADSKKVLLGSGDDLEIFHDGSHSRIVNTTGWVGLQSDNTQITDKEGVDVIANFLHDGAVELYYDNSKKIATSSGGVNVTGELTVTTDLVGIDSSKLKLGNSSDLQIYHDGTNSRITNTSSNDFLLDTAGDFYIRNTNTEKYIKCVANGAVSLYYNNILTCYTGNGALQFPDDQAIFMGAGNDLQIFHDGNDSFIEIPNGSVGNFIVDIKQQNCGMFARTTSTAVSNLTLKKNSSGADSVDYFQCRNSSNALKMVIDNSGSIANVNNSYGQISDSKLKENIVDANSQWDDIKAVKVRNFNFKASTGFDTHKQIGVVAQEIETVSAGLVSESIDRDPDTNADLGTKTKAVKYSILYMKAIKALQEAMVKIETLETKVAALEAK